jgi:HK97 gp10 family phage protein
MCRGALMVVHVIEEFNLFAQYAQGMEEHARGAVQRSIMRIRARSIASMSGPHSGRTYRRGAIKSRRKADKGAVIGYKFHRASAPGETPAIDTGALANSFQTRMTGRTEGEVSVHVEYAAALEFGSAKMAARPFLTPAVKSEWPEFLADMQQVGV